MKTELNLIAPLSGLVIPLSDVPDQVFASGVIGQGIAIDPLEGKVLSPCDGKIISVHPSRHALTLESDNGTQILIHIGIDTVKLRGEGFTTKVKPGDQVKAGELLLEFDLDAVALSATSLVSPVIVVEPKNAFLKITTEKKVKARDQLINLSLGSQIAVTQTGSEKTLTSSPLLITDPTGLHARPAAVIAKLASEFESKIEIEYEGKKANAKGLIGIMSLEIPGKAVVSFHASGADARKAIDALEKSLGVTSITPTNQNTYSGVVGSKGRASGKITFLKRGVKISETSSDGKNQKEKLEEAIAQAKQELLLVEESMKKSVGAAEAAIFSAHRSLLEDPDLLEAAFSAVEKGKSAAEAWEDAVQKLSAQLKTLKNEVLAARATDVYDVGQRVLSRLLGTKTTDFSQLTEDSILIAEDIGPGDLAHLRGTKIVGICTTGGGATSHAAILARALGLPALHGVSKNVLTLKETDVVLLDALNGELKLSPTESELKEVIETNLKVARHRAEELKECSKPAVTADGHHVHVAANLASDHEALEASEFNAEGVGLLRTELYFAEKSSEPTENEQFEFYQTVAKKFKDKPVIIRTLDVGGDKPLSYLPMKPEANPFLGERGIRFTFAHENVFRRQIRAIVRAGEFGNVHIMFPMITTLAELRTAKKILEEETKNLNAKKIPVGIMIEVPAAAILADQFATEVDFFSIGTNDLTQYTLAMDRTHPGLSNKVDGLNPSVLRLIQMTVEAAHKNGKWVGVCGGMAAEPEAIPVLLALGVDELSVSVPAIPSVRAVIKKLNLADAKKALRTML